MGNASKARQGGSFGAKKFEIVQTEKMVATKTGMPRIITEEHVVGVVRPHRGRTMRRRGRKMRFVRETEKPVMPIEVKRKRGFFEGAANMVRKVFQRRGA